MSKENQKPQIEGGQTEQWLKDKQWSTKHSTEN